MANDNPRDISYDISGKSVPRLSVLMPLYNGERFLSEALESILSQTFTDFELLIVDDGSSDSSASIVRSFAARDSRVRGFFLRKNVGIAPAMNIGLREARAPLIARADCDDFCAVNRFAQQVAYMDRHPDICILGCRAVIIDEDDNMIEGVGDYKLTFAMGHRQISNNISRGDYPLLHPALMYRRAGMLALGGYREVFPVGEDLDLYERMFVRLGCVFANLSKALYFYRRYPSSLSSASGKYNVKKRHWINAQLRHSSDCFRHGFSDPLAAFKSLPFPPLSGSTDELIIMELVFYFRIYRNLLYRSFSQTKSLRSPTKNLRRLKMIRNKLSRLPKDSKIVELLGRRFFLLLLPVMPSAKDEREDFLKSFDDALFNRDGVLDSIDYSNSCIVVARGCLVFGEWKYFIRYMFIAFRIDFTFTLRFIFSRALAHLVR